MGLGAVLSRAGVACFVEPCPAPFYIFWEWSTITQQNICRSYHTPRRGPVAVHDQVLEEELAQSRVGDAGGVEQPVSRFASGDRIQRHCQHRLEDAVHDGRAGGGE